LEQGYAHQPTPILSAAECEQLRMLNTEDALFRARIQMERFRFGVGSYGYFAKPLPELVSELRAAAYPHLVPVANEWMERLELSKRYPDDLAAYLATCHEAGQTRPTPLLLHYRAGGYNCLHQDLYGEEAFPFQIVVQLSKPQEEFTGGEFLMVEQRPRAVGRQRRPAWAGRNGGVYHAISPDPRQPGLLPCQRETWGEPHPFRRALHAGHHLSRCGMMEL